MKKNISPALFLFLVFFLLAAPVPGASEWEEYSRDDGGNIYSYKINKSKGKIVEAWDLKVFSAEGRRKHIQELTKSGFSADGYDHLSTVKVLVEIDCRKKRGRALSVNMFDTNNRALYSMYYDKPEWAYFQADSLWAKLQSEVCR